LNRAFWKIHSLDHLQRIYRHNISDNHEKKYGLFFQKNFRGWFVGSPLIECHP
jgi:hypothetical protein